MAGHLPGPVPAAGARTNVQCRLAGTVGIIRPAAVVVDRAHLQWCRDRAGTERVSKGGCTWLKPAPGTSPHLGYPQHGGHPAEASGCMVRCGWWYVGGTAGTTHALEVMFATREGPPLALPSTPCLCSCCVTSSGPAGVSVVRCGGGKARRGGSARAEAAKGSSEQARRTRRQQRSLAAPQIGWARCASCSEYKHVQHSTVQYTRDGRITPTNGVGNEAIQHVLQAHILQTLPAVGHAGVVHQQLKAGQKKGRRRPILCRSGPGMPAAQHQQRRNSCCHQRWQAHAALPAAIRAPIAHVGVRCRCLDARCPAAALQQLPPPVSTGTTRRLPPPPPPRLTSTCGASALTPAAHRSTEAGLDTSSCVTCNRPPAPVAGLGATLDGNCASWTGLDPSRNCACTGQGSLEQAQLLATAAPATSVPPAPAARACRSSACAGCCAVATTVFPLASSWRKSCRRLGEDEGRS